MKNCFFCVAFIFATNLFQNIYGLYENDYCTNSNGEKGICKKEADCKMLKEMLRSGEKPKICGWQKNGRSPIICCVPDKVKPITDDLDIVKPKESNGVESGKLTDRSKLVELVRQKCVEYGKYVKIKINNPAIGSNGEMIEIDNCGRLAESLIVGGVEAKPKEFPHMALIGYQDPPKYACGGSLISERFVLSAAHCSEPQGKGLAKWALLGELDTSTDTDNAYPNVYQIIQIINHPQFDPTTLYNDISLFKLEKDVEFHGYTRPLCLDTKLEAPQGLLTASGWGHLQFSGERSSRLMKVNLKFVSNDVCSFNYSDKIDESVICAGGEIGKDTCQGDSGGPLQENLVEPYCMYDLIGITSYGQGCGFGNPGVYTRVSHYISWIVPHVWPDNK